MGLLVALIGVAIIAAVPTDTALAPARRNSIASSAQEIPPIPMIGMFTACAT